MATDRETLIALKPHADTMKQMIDTQLGAVVPEPPQADMCQLFIERMYVSYLGRSPQNGEESWWLEQCRMQPKPPGQTKQEIENAFRREAGLPPLGEPPVTPTPVPPSGNFILVPQWEPWNVQYGVPTNNPGYRMYSGQVAAFVVPIGTGQSKVTLHIGQMGMTPGNNEIELYLSREAGLINPNDAAMYFKGLFSNNMVYEVWIKEDPLWNPVHIHEMLESGGPAYLNMRWTYPPAQYEPGQHSIQWN